MMMDDGWPVNKVIYWRFSLLNYYGSLKTNIQ